MRKIFALIFTLTAGLLQAQNLQTTFAYCQFTSLGQKTYIETYLSVRGSTLQLVRNAEGLYAGSVNVTMLVTQGETIFFADKFNMAGPAIADTNGLIPNFIDIKQIPLAPGSYTLELTVVDAALPNAKPVEGKVNITLGIPTNAQTSISDILPLESFTSTTNKGAGTKSGFAIVPLTSNFIGPQLNSLGFYTEIYLAKTEVDSANKFIVNTYIEKVTDAKPLDLYFKTKVYTSKEVVPILHQFNIAKLPTGNYNLTVQVKNKLGNQVAIKRYFFQRSNPAADSLNPTALVMLKGSSFDGFLAGLKKDSLREIARCTRPIANVKERDWLDKNAKNADSLALIDYLSSFWIYRNAKDPLNAFAQYYNQVLIVNQQFKTAIKPGYATDRGRVFLQYGPPNSRAQAPREPGAYPYEIWHYYEIGKQKNRRFVFYNPDLVSNDYTLLHSDALGEQWDDQWQLRLFRRDTPINNLDQMDVNPTYGGQSRDLFINPR